MYAQKNLYYPRMALCICILLGPGEHNYTSEICIKNPSVIILSIIEIYRLLGLWYVNADLQFSYCFYSPTVHEYNLQHIPFVFSLIALNHDSIHQESPSNSMVEPIKEPIFSYT